MSLSKQTLTRLPKIKSGLLQKMTREQIGLQCHVTEKTIDRDVKAWVRTPDFEQWLKELWLEEYSKIDDVEVFRAVTKLLGKMVTQKIEATTTTTIDERVTINVTEDEDSILNRAASILNKKLPRTKKSDSIH